MGNYLLREAEHVFMDPHISVNRVEAVSHDRMLYLPGVDIRETIKEAEKIRQQKE